MPRETHRSSHQLTATRQDFPLQRFAGFRAILASDDEDRTVGVMDYGAGDAAHHGAPDGPHPPAAQDHESGVQLLRSVYDLHLRFERASSSSARLRMSP